jgi:hypothetical protein
LIKLGINIPIIKEMKRSNRSTVSNIETNLLILKLTIHLKMCFSKAITTGFVRYAIINPIVMGAMICQNLVKESFIFPLINPYPKRNKIPIITIAKITFL